VSTLQHSNLFRHSFLALDCWSQICRLRWILLTVVLCCRVAAATGLSRLLGQSTGEYVGNQVCVSLDVPTSEAMVARADVLCCAVPLQLLIDGKLPQIRAIYQVRAT
jgi:hypothetical protein